MEDMSERFTFGSTTLIQLVEDRPCIWDHSSPDYKLKRAKEEAWHEIYVNMQPDFDSLPKSKQISLGNQITHRWHNIRDAYVKYLKGHYKTRTRPYLYHEYLTFLANSLQSKRGMEKIINLAQDSQIEMEEYYEPEVLEENALENEEEESSNVTPTSSGAKRKSDDPLAEVLLKLLKKNQDEDEAFFTSLLPEVRRMSSNTKYNFRIEVMRIIKRLKKSTKVKNEVESDSD